MTKKTLKIIDDTLKEIKALDTKILNLKKINSFTDVLLITSGSSSTHMSAISNKLIRSLKKNKIEIINLEGKNSADWVLLDLGDIVINVMSISAREYYDLESLWDNSLA
jgi:ribosome-associated protein